MEIGVTSTASSTEAAPTARQPLRCLPQLALLLAIAAAVLLALGPLGWGAGLFNYRVAFDTLFPWAAYCGIAAAALALIALVFGRRIGGGRRLAMCTLAFVVGAAIAYVPWRYDQMRGTVPPIHDITTDPQNPPQFRAVLPARDKERANPAAYEGAVVADQQRRFYPDIAPLSLALDPRKAFARALDAAMSMGWTIVASDAAEGRIEASERSFWFGFTDDVVVRITASGAGSRVDIRSVSRVGRSDFGVNASRVRAYLAKLRAVAGSR
jgi:uncharacterized protein (DUF1499 family)